MNIGMKAASAAAMMAFAVSASASDVCWTPKELDAARVRDVQTIMMVGALHCSAQGYNTSFGYDRFVTRHRADLVASNDTLKNHFMRSAAASAGQRDYDSFVTRLANSHAIEAQDMSRYCARVDSLVRSAVSVPGEELAAFAADVTDSPAGVGETCRRSEIAAIDVPVAARDEDLPRGRSRYEVAAEREALPPPPVEAEMAPPPVEVADTRMDDRRYDDQRYDDRRPVEDERIADDRDERDAPPPPPARLRQARLEAPLPVEERAPVEAVEEERAPVRTAAVRAPAPAAGDSDVALKQATAALQQATLALQAAMAHRQAAAGSVVATPAAATVRAPAIAGPRRATVNPTVLAPEPVLPPDTNQFVG